MTPPPLPVNLTALQLHASKQRDEGGDRSAEASMRGSIENGLPIIDRMCAILAFLEGRHAGASIGAVADGLALPRSTVYRALNTLESHGIVRRSPAGRYTLGPRLLTFGSQVTAKLQATDLAALVGPHLQRLSGVTGESSKVSVRDGDRALVIAVAQGTSPYGLATVAGQSFPLHVGGASKLLLAYAEESEVERLLGQPLQSFTRRTVVEPRRLLSGLARIRRHGWAEDPGEYSGSVHALAAPIRDGTGRVIAALSVPFLADRDDDHRLRIRSSLLAAAEEISAALQPGEPGPFRNAPCVGAQGRRQSP
jgi:DNA-binding IclR family transcriptional regulator